MLLQFSRRTPSEAKEQQQPIHEQHVENSHGASAQERISSASNGRRGIDAERQSMLPSLARPMSVIPPRGSSNKTHKTRSYAPVEANEPEEHVDSARAQSLAALQGTVSAAIPKSIAMESGLQRSSSTRLPQAPPRVGGPAIPSRTTSVRLKDSPGRKHRKASGIHTAAVITVTDERTSPPNLRLESSTASLMGRTSIDSKSASTEQPTTIPRTRTASQAPQTTSPPRSSVMSRPRPASQILPAPLKPSFSTYQQHYSPAKSSLPKPPLPSSKHKSKVSTTSEEDVPADFETTKQQIELLQLSLLHQSSSKCMNEYTASAKRRLNKMHSKLRKEYESLRATELVHQRASNLSAMDTWCPDTGLLVENLQILSLVYSDLTSLMEEGSRHSDVVSMFELWMNEAEHPESKAFIQPLPDDWKAAHASLALKLRSIQRNLRVLPPPRPSEEGSGMGVVLKACKTLVEDMLKELEVMAKLETEVLARESVRVEDEVRSLIMSDVVMNENEHGKGVRVPAWQRGEQLLG